MISSFSIGPLNVSLVLRHRFEKRSNVWDRTFTRWEIGAWYKKSKMVGQTNFSNPKKWKNHLVTSHMLGIELLIFRAWIEFDFGGMHMEIDI